MSSNIKTKNLIYKLNKYDELPYQSSQMITYDGNNNSYVNMVQLNNTYGQCVDNDMFIAKTLLNKFDKNAFPGPKVIVDENEIAGLPDGAKFFASRNGSSIMQKKVMDFQQSLSKCKKLAFNDVRFVHSIGSQLAIVCTSSSTFIVSIDEISSSTPFNPSTVVKDNNNANFIVTAVFNHGRYSKFVFAGHPAGKPSGLYALDIALNENNKYYFKPFSSFQVADDICTMSAVENSNRIAFATKSTLYLGSIDSSNVYNVTPVGTFSSSIGTGSISAVLVRSSKVIVFTDIGSIYDVSYSTSYNGFYNASIKQIFDNAGIVVYDRQVVNSIQYFATSSGLCVMRSGSLEIVDENYTSPVKHLEVDSNGIVWFGDEAGRVLFAPDSHTVTQYSNVNSAITDMRIVNNVKLLATANGMMYEQSHAYFQGMQHLYSIKSAKMIDGFSSNNMYVAGTNAGQLSVVNASFDVHAGNLNFNFIDGLSQLSAFSMSGYSSSIFALVRFNGIDYAFVNFKSTSGSIYNSVLFNATSKSQYSSYNGAGQAFTGVIRMSSTEMYVFTSKNILHFYVSSGSVQHRLLAIPKILEEYTIVDYAVDGRRCVLSLVNSEGSCILANVVFNNDDNEINVIETVTIGVSSNIVKFNNDYVAFVKSGSTSSLSAFDLKHQMQNYAFDDINDEFQQLQSIYDSIDAQIVNNLSYRVKDTLLYRRADYIVPSTGDISAVKSFLSIENPGDDNDVTLKCFSVQQINGTSNVSSIDSAYDISSCTGTCYISSGNSVYTFQAISSQSKILNPSSPFTASSTEQAVDQNVFQSIVSQVEFDKIYDSSQELTSYDGNMSAYEICNDNTLWFVNPHTYSYLNSGNWTTSTQIAASSNINCGSLIPKLMCKSGSDVYVLLFNGTNQYSVKKIVSSNGSHSLVAVVDGITSTQSLKSFVFEHDNQYDRMLDYLDGQTIDGQFPVDDNVFESYASNFQLSDYVINHQIVPDIASGKIHIVFDRAECIISISSGASPSKSVVEWDDKDVDCTLAFNQTRSNVENALFTYNMCAQNTSMPLIFKLNSTDSKLSFLSRDVMLHGKAVPSQLEGSSVIEHDKQLNCTLVVKNGNATIYNSSFSIVSQINVPVNAHDIHLMQCFNQQFSAQPHIAYILYSSELAKYQLYIDGNAEPIYSSPVDFSTIILNSDTKYPLIAYSSSIGTIKYESTYTISVSIVNSTALSAVGLRAFAIDSTNSQYTYVAAGNSLFHVRMNSSNSPSSTVLSYSTIKDVVFPNNMFGTGLYGYANTNDAKPISFYANGTTIVVTQLDESQQLEKYAAIASVGLLLYDSGKYTMYCEANNKSFYVDFSKFGSVNSISKSGININYGEGVKDIVQLNDLNSYALQSQHYIYSFNDYNGVERINQMFHSSSTIAFLKEYENKNSYSYFANLQHSLVSSDNLKSWTHIANVNSSSGIINDFELMNSYVSLISKTKSNDAGLYYTYYSYFIDNNSQEFTAESAYYAYYDNTDEIDSLNSAYLADHIYSNHTNPASDMALLNNYMDTSFELSNFMKMNSQNDVQNDYIDQIIAGDNTDDNILVFASNTAVNSKWNQLTCNYIAKCWKSGLTELYIYIPTTNTHYIPHIFGASQCYGSNEQVQVNGRFLTSNIKDNFTSIRINIVSSYFTVDTLMENTIKPNSLPLRIFKDADAEDEAAGSMFHSFVCPSVAKEFSQDDSMLGYQSFNYYCFGSDAQAVKLTFFNKQPNYGRKYKIIEYKANGGMLTAFPGMKSIQQRIYEGDDPVPLYWQIFERDGAFFTGWSQSSTAVDGSQAYASGTMISYESFNSVRLTLYACWISYRFGANDTTINISNTESIDYTIAEIAIDPNASIPDNPSLGNKLIIDYGD